MTWLLVLGAVLGGYWLFLRRDPPVFYRQQHQSDAPQFVQSMFMHLRPGAVAHFQVENAVLGFRLRTIRLPDNDLGIRLEVPDSPDTRSLENALRSHLSRVGFACLPPSPIDRLWPAQDPPLFISKDLPASETVRIVEAAREGMLLGSETRYTIHMEGIPSLAAIKEHARKRQRSAS